MKIFDLTYKRATSIDSVCGENEGRSNTQRIHTRGSELLRLLFVAIQRSRSHLVLDILLPVGFRRWKCSGGGGGGGGGGDRKPAFAFVHADLFPLTPRRVSLYCVVPDPTHREHSAREQALIILTYEKRGRHAGQDDQDEQSGYGVLDHPRARFFRRLRELRRKLVRLRYNCVLQTGIAFSYRFVHN